MKASVLVLALIGATPIQVLNGQTLGQTTISVASSPNPSNPGQAVTLSANLGWPSGSTGTPTGLISFLDGRTFLGNANINATTGQAAFTTSALAGGSHSITASYPGDSNFTGSTSSVLTQVVNSAGKIATKTTLASSQSLAAPGQQITFTASVAANTGATAPPTGNVTFLDGTTTLGFATLNSTSMATFITSTLSLGSHSITAQYAGDGNFLGSTSSALTEVVGTPNFMLSVNPAAITISQGSFGTITVTVMSAVSLNQAVSFACSGLPAAASCSFSPSTVTANGNTNASTTLTVATSGTTASQAAPVHARKARGIAGFLFAVIFIGTEFLARARRRGILRALVLLPMVGLWVSGCVVGGSPGNAKGSRMVTLTATAGTLHQTTAFTLNVQ